MLENKTEETFEYECKELLSRDPTQGCQLIGAFRAFHGIKDGYVVLHSPPGCHSGMLLLRALYDNADVRVAFSGMHSRDSIYGAAHKALKRIKPDLVIPPAFFGTDPDWYEKHGFKTLVPNRLAGYFFRMGYWTVVDAAIEARRALERPCSSTPLLSMIEQDEEYGGLSKYWADNARVFRDVWYEAI